MVNIAKIGMYLKNEASKVQRPIGKWIARAHTSEWYRKWASDPNAFAKLALYSTASKDAVNCIWYTYQSYTNEKIPKEKRKFVSFLDLFNGLINVSVPLAIGSKLADGSNWAFDKINKKLNPEQFKEALEKYKVIADTKKVDKDIIRKIEKEMGDFNPAGKKGLGVLITLVVSQILIKRVLTPFISTPLASYTKEYADKKHPHKPEHEQPKQPEQPVIAQTPAVSAGSTNLFDKFMK